MTINWPRPGSPPEFEDFCCTFLKHIAKSLDLRRHGCSGQRQNGIDLLGSADGRQLAAQCKPRKGKPPSLQELRGDIDAATKAFPDLARLYIFISTDRDTTLQRDIVTLSVERELQGLFPLSLYFWSDIESDARADAVLHDRLKTHCFPHEMSNQKQTEILLKAFQSSIASQRPTPVAGSGDSDIDTAIDTIWCRVEEGKLEYALEAYTDIRAKQWGLLTDKQKYRVLGNIGSIYKLLGKYSDAARYYHDAASHHDSQASRLLDAMGHWLEDNLQEAFAIASSECSSETPSARAHMIRLRTSSLQPSLADAVESVPEQVANDPEVLSVFHAFAMNEGRLAEAERYARKIVELSPEWIDGRLMLCRVLLRRVQDGHLQTGVPLTDPSISSLMIECRHLTEQVIDNASALPVYRADATQLRSMLFWLAGDLDKHLRDLRQARQLDPDHVPTTFALAQAEADRGHFQDGVDLLDTVRQSDRSLYWARSYAECLRGLGPTRCREALDAMLGFLYELDGVPIGVSLDYLQRARRLAIELDVGDELVERLETEPSVSPLIREITLAVLAFEMDRTERADRHITTAVANLPESAGRIEREMLATGFAKLDRFEDAAAILLPTVRTDVFGDSERLYLRSLWYAKRLKPILTHCRASRAIGLWNRDLMSILVDALMEIPSPNQAMTELTAWLADHSEDEHTQLHLGTVQFMAGHADTICTDLSKLPDADDCSPNDGFQVVQLLLNAEPAQPDAARHYAYRLWRRYKEEKVAWRALILSVFHPATDRGEHHPPSTVTNDTAVLVKTTSGEMETYVIETGRSPRSEYDEISPGHPIAASLLGSCNGAEVDLPAMGAPRKAVVVAIYDKVFFRARFLSNAWQRRWPNDGFVRPINGTSPQNSVDELLAIATTALQAERSHRDSVYGHYVDQRASIHTFAHATGISACMAVLKLSATPKHIIVAWSGSTTDQQAASATLQSSKEVVLDSTALATALAIPEVAQALQAFPLPRSVPDCALAEFHATIKHIRNGERACGSVSLDETGHLRIYEHSPEQTSKEQEHLDRSSSAIIKSVQPAGSEDVLDLVDGVDRIEAGIALGTSLHAIALAKARDGVLWTDDFVTARLAGRYGVASVWSAAVLAHLRDTEALAAADVERALVTLYLAGWRAAHLNTSTLVYALRDSNWKFDDQRLLGLFDVFADPKVSIGSLSNILVGICQSLEHGPDRSRLDDVLEFILPIMDRHPEGRLGIERAEAILRKDDNYLISPVAALKVEFWLATAPPRIVAQPTRLWLPSWRR